VKGLGFRAWGGGLGVEAKSQGSGEEES